MTNDISRRTLLRSSAAAASFAAIGNWDEILGSIQQQGDEVIPWTDTPANFVARGSLFFLSYRRGHLLDVAA